jgi:2-keto-4-pentenoate hydratase/2-oxohepta-3-ene-1,7-dioic acid hydratase in catechol pathway
MAINVLRYRLGDSIRFGVIRGSGIAVLDRDFSTTGEFLVHGAAEARALATAPPTLRLDEVEILSPITLNQQIVCQGLNYRSHWLETGQDPDARSFNMLFRKASSALAPATSPIVRPRHVELLDYELELGLVVGCGVDRPLDVTGERLGEVVGALVMTNDVSARDVQIPQGQFYKGKSYRTFAPTGPWLTLLEDDELARIPELELSLTVNGELRQHGRVSDLVYGPAETLRELSRIQDLAPGDLICTGTPGGVALALPGAAAQRVAALLPERLRWRLFLRSQRRNPCYLKPGDVVVSRIRTADGAIDLGEQRNMIVDEPSPERTPEPTRA